MNDSVKWALFSSLTAINVVILAPCCWYFSRQFYKHRRNMVIHKRYPKLTMIWCILSILSITITRPLYLFTYTICDDPQNFNLDCNYIQNQNFIFMMHYIHTFFFYLTHFAGWVLLLRYWLIYFNVNWTKATLSKTWKIHLNHLEIAKNWYLSHKSTFGNSKYCLKRMTIVYLIVAAIMVCLMIFALESDGPSINAIAGLLFNIAPLVIMCILVYKIRAFGDNFYIVQEIKWLIIVTFIASIGYLIIRADMSLFMRSFCANLISIFKSVVGLYIQTMYTLKLITTDQDQSVHRIASAAVEMMSRDVTPSAERSKSSKSNLSKIEPKASTNSINTNSTSIRTKTSTHTSNTYLSKPTTYTDTNYNDTISLTDSLRESDKFEDFMLHLSRDFSMEILLSFIELTQLQKVIKQYLYENDGKMEFSPTQEAFLQNTDIPKSYIVYHTDLEDVMKSYGIILRQEHNLNDKMVDLKLRACALFWKYIGKGDLQLNVSYEQRQRLQSLMHDADYFVSNVNLNAGELFLLYHEVITDVSKILSHSHHRFCVGVTNE